MSDSISWIDNHFYPNHKNNWDDWLFREKIISHISDDSIVLDLGAGAGIVSQMDFRDKVAYVCGVDLDSRVVDNQMLDEGRVSDAGEIPYDDNYFDIVFSDNVLEHLDQPLDVFEEVNRVLKPGGVFVFKTPNMWHYMPVIARLTPHFFHKYVNKIRGRSEVDTFPTRYRANTKRDIIKLADASGFYVDSIERIEGRPEYLRMMWLTYIFGIIYERLVSSSCLFEWMRVLLVGSLRKK